MAEESPDVRLQEIVYRWLIRFVENGPPDDLGADLEPVRIVLDRRRARRPRSGSSGGGHRITKAL